VTGELAPLQPLLYRVDGNSTLKESEMHLLSNYVFITIRKIIHCSITVLCRILQEKGGSWIPGREGAFCGWWCL